LLSAVIVVSKQKHVFVIALMLAIPALGGRWISHFRPAWVPPAFFLIATLVCTAFVVVNLLGFIFRAPSVDVEVLCASISVYLMLGLLATIMEVLDTSVANVSLPYIARKSFRVDR
jgi:hypothetical protein